MRKIIKIIIFIVLVLLVGFTIVLQKMVKKKSNINDNLYDTTQEEYYKSRFGLANLTDEEKNQIYDWEVNGAHELIRLMCLKNGDWSKLPISKETREQFNEKDGILKDYEFESVEVDYEGVEYYDASPAKIIITNGKEKKRVYVDYRFTDEGINYISIEDIITIVDNNGNKLNEGFPFNDKHIVMNFETWENVGLTDKYVSNHGKELLNLFTHYSPLDYNPITFDKTKSKLNNHMAYFIVTSVLECKEREYEVYYQLDENNYLDDAYAVCVKERELEPDNKNSGTKAFYLNSNLDNANLSDEFKQYIKKHGSYNSDIKDICINYFAEEVCLNEGEYTKFIRCYKMNNGDINSYYVEYMFDNNIINNIISTKLPYKNMSAKEVKELYLKDIENKNN